MSIPAVHTVTLTRPKASTDKTTNVTSLDYRTPEKKATVQGALQTRDGTVKEFMEGRFCTFDAVFYTERQDVKVDDLIEMQRPFVGKWLVTNWRPRVNRHGEFTYGVADLTKEIKR